MPLRERLAKTARDANDRVATLPPGSEREALLLLMKKIDYALELDSYLSAAALQPSP
jgi:hypothetical protein